MPYISGAIFKKLTGIFGIKLIARKLIDFHKNVLYAGFSFGAVAPGG